MKLVLFGLLIATILFADHFDPAAWRKLARTVIPRWRLAAKMTSATT